VREVMRWRPLTLDEAEAVLLGAERISIATNPYDGQVWIVRHVRISPYLFALPADVIGHREATS
jgi:hypothetical protein